MIQRRNWRDKTKKTKSIITVENLKRAEMAIIRIAQHRAFQEEV